VTEKSDAVTGNGGHGPEELKRYYELMLVRDLVELEIRDKDFYLKLSRQGPQHIAAPLAAAPASVPSTPAPEAAPAPIAGPAHTIASPLAGMFYRSPSPKSSSFVKEGDKVAYGDVLCIVEAMKVMNEIRADRPCVIAKILAENGKPVAAGQDLFQIEPIA
jgi:acetyl-CoA carboxylase biotin carboxyl carrier protein